MKIEARGNDIVLKEVYSGVLLETSKGNSIGICMRDDTFEINVIPKGSKERRWHRVNMQSGTIEKEKVSLDIIKNTESGVVNHEPL